MVVPISYYKLGVEFRPLADRLADACPVPNAPSVRLEPGSNLFDRFTYSFWSTLKQRIDKLGQYRFSKEYATALFSEAMFSTNIAAIRSGLNPQVRNVIQNGAFSFNDLISLPKLTSTWPGEGSGIYLRIYTHLDAKHQDIDQAAMYIGLSTQLWRRQREHELAIVQGQKSPHYDMARKSLPQNRHIILLCFWDARAIRELPKEFLTMAEQTMISAFDSYHPVVAASKPAAETYLTELISHGTYLRSVAQQTSNGIGWRRWPAVPFAGCNVASPLFGIRQVAEVSCIRMESNDPAINTYTTYRVRSGVVKLPTQPSAIASFFWHEGGVRKQLSTNLVPELFGGKIPKAGYFVFEIMHDGKPHPRPWVGFPSVGTYENFDHASSLGIRFEWLDEARNAWLTVPVARKVFLGNSGLPSFLELWKKAITLIQLLEGITYTGDPSFFGNNATLGSMRVNELKVDHLRQTCRWVPRMGSVRPAPIKARWNDNFQLMVRQFAHDATLVGLEKPPDVESAFWTPTAKDTYAHRSKKVWCDLCRYSTTAGFPECERDLTRTDIWVCKFCSLLNRPCTWTPRSIAADLWGTEPPFLWHRYQGWTQFPTGPHRFLAFHHAVPGTELKTPVRVKEPLEGKYGLYLEDEAEEENE